MAAGAKEWCVHLAWLLQRKWALLVKSFKRSRSRLHDEGQLPLIEAAAGAISVADVLRSPKWPDTWPFFEDDFSRLDRKKDSRFYRQPRFVHHIEV